MAKVSLRTYDNGWYNPGGTWALRLTWFLLGQPILGASWIPSSSLRVRLLRLFGAEIGERVVIKPGVSVKYPWHLRIGSDCWVGERSWIDNLTTVSLGDNTCVSQGAYLCTGNHNWSSPSFDLMIAPIHVEAGAWLGAMCIISPGTVVGEEAVVSAGAVAHGLIPPHTIVAGNPARFVRTRTVRDAKVHGGEAVHSA